VLQRQVQGFRRRSKTHHRVIPNPFGGHAFALGSRPRRLCRLAATLAKFASSVLGATMSLGDVSTFFCRAPQVFRATARRLSRSGLFVAILYCHDDRK
jgi:hypothetical protein